MPDRLRLDPILDMPATGRLARQLAGISAPVEVDASAVSHLGALAAQLLLSARKTRRGDQPMITICAPSPDFLDGLTRLGIPPARLTG